MVEISAVQGSGLRSVWLAAILRHRNTTTLKTTYRRQQRIGYAVILVALFITNVVLGLAVLQGVPSGSAASWEDEQEGEVGSDSRRVGRPHGQHPAKGRTYADEEDAGCHNWTSAFDAILETLWVSGRGKVRGSGCRL